MLHRSYMKNNVSALNDVSIEKELLGAAISIAVPPEADTHLLLAAGTGSHSHRSRTQEMPSQIDTNQLPPLEIYTAYARDDERFFKKIKEQLDILHRQDWPISGHENEIIYSKAWQRSNHLATANLILLLVSTTFLNSDFCYCKQMFLAVERHKTDKLCCVIPIILHPFHHLLFERTPFGGLEFLPTNGKPISTWKEPRKAYTEITGYLLEKIQYMAYYL